jgi:hypothetical protein
MSYRERFRSGWVPETLDLGGRYAVALVGPLLPELRFFKQCKCFEKVNDRITGYNEFLGFIKVARFRVEKGGSLADPSLEVIRIVYDHPSNPAIVRRLVDEIRQVGPGEYLGQGMYRILGKPRWAFWFSVRKI